MKTHGLHKTERLKSRKAIESLFREARKDYIYPIKMLWRYADQPEEHVRMTVVVPKRRIKSAVKRNLVKRRMREAYRQNKHILLKHLPEQDRKIEVLFLFQSEKIVDYTHIERSMKQLLSILSDR